MKPERLKKIGAFCVSLLLACNSAWVHAQADDDEDETLSPSTLTAAPPPSIPRPATEELFVTGSYIKGLTQDQLASPLQIIDREELLSLGAVQMLDIVNNLTINTGSENNTDAFTQNYTTGTSNFNLRGLGVASTLVLLNGRRQTYSAFANDKGENFVDTSSLVPLIAVESIEILKDGATSLYGSDAVAGVVNFKTRKNFDGFEVEIDTQSGTADQANNSISAIFGHSGSNTQILAAFSYLKRDGVGTDKRRLSTVEDDLSAAGFPGSFLSPFAPVPPTLAGAWQLFYNNQSNFTHPFIGNQQIADFFEPLLAVVGGSFVEGSLPPMFADPNCQTVAATDDTTVPPATFPLGPCGFDFGSFFTIVPEEENTKVFASLTQQFGNDMELYIEAGFVNFEADRRSSPSFPITTTPVICGNGSLDALPGSDPDLPPCAAVGAHPDNPFGVDVLFVGRALASGADAAITHFESDTARLAAEISGTLGDDWNWSADVTFSRNEYLVRSEDTLAQEFQLALRGLGGANCSGNPVDAYDASVGCLTFNPFGSSLLPDGHPNASPRRNTEEIYNYITGTLLIQAESELQTLSGVVNGPLFSLPGGDASLATGVQLRKETLKYGYDENSLNKNFLFTVGNDNFDTEREITAAFGELALPFTDSFSLQFSVRYEDYDDAGNSVDPKLAVLFNPTDSLSFRASIATAFRAPSLFQQYGSRIVLDEIILPGLGTQFRPVSSSPNPEDPLKPEEATIANIGASWGHDEGFNISADYWNFDYENVIIQQNAQAILDQAVSEFGPSPTQYCNAEQIECNNSNSLTQINAYYANASTLKTNGIDLRTGYNWLQTATGNYSINLELTKTLTYDIEDPQAGKVDGLGRRNFANFATSAPELRANLQGAWHNAKHGFHIWLRYIDSYVNDQHAADETISSHQTVVLQYSYLFDPIGSAQEGILLSIGGYNVTDELPPYVKTSGGYDSKVHDPRGSLYYLKATIPF